MNGFRIWLFAIVSLLMTSFFVTPTLAQSESALIAQAQVLLDAEGVRAVLVGKTHKGVWLDSKGKEHPYTQRWNADGTMTYTGNKDFPGKWSVADDGIYHSDLFKKKNRYTIHQLPDGHLLWTNLDTGATGTTQIVGGG